MSFKFYSELRGSLVKHDSKTINPGTLKKLLQLFAREKKFFFENLHSTYNERSLFSTLYGYTSAELFMDRLTDIEQKNIILLIDLITNGIQSSAYHDFQSILAVGSTTYPESYRTELEHSLNTLDYTIIDNREKVTIEEYNTSYESITKEQLSQIIHQRGNDIDIVLTGFSNGNISSMYYNYYHDNIRSSIKNKLYSEKRSEILQKFIFKKITEDQFFILVNVEDKEGFQQLHQELQDGKEYGAESRELILSNKYKITLSKTGIQEIPLLTNKDIILFLNSKKKYIKEKGEYIRDQYLEILIPNILIKNNISYSIENRREDGSHYTINYKEKSIKKSKYISPYDTKKGCLIIKFPDCRPIHLNVDTSTIKDLYDHEQNHNKSFSLLLHDHIEKKEFLKKDRNNKITIPENLSLEEQIKYIRKNKPKINWKQRIEKNQNSKFKGENNKDNEELPF